MPSLQNAAPGALSSKMKGLNPFTPFLAQPGDLDGDDDGGHVEQILSETMDRRLRIVAPRPQQQLQMPETGHAGQAPPQEASSSAAAAPQTTAAGVNGTNADGGNLQQSSKTKKKDDDSDDDSDFDEFDDDDAALEAFRQRRLAELKKSHQVQSEQTAKGHGEVRTISQDEFLPECSGSSRFVVVHFCHDDFERSKLMDHHLKIIAQTHLNCKFVRIYAEKAPFFVTKLAIQTLPTVLVFRDGKTIDRLTGFEGLSDSKNPDAFSTSRLGRWLEHTGAIEYEGPDSDDEGEVGSSNAARQRVRTGMLQSRVQVVYDEDV